MLGKVDHENVTRYLHLDANALYLEILENLGTDLRKVLETIEKLNERVSPATCYERMADVSMLAYRLSHLGATSVPSYWDRDRLVAVGDLHKEFLVEFGQRFAERPAYATVSMFICDVSALHQRRAGIVVTATQRVEVTVPSTAVVAPKPAPAPVSASPEPPATMPEPADVDRVVQSVMDAPETPPTEPPNQPIEPSPNEVTVQSTPSTEKAQADAGSIGMDPYVNEVGVHINPPAQQMSRGKTSNVSSDGSSGVMATTSFVETLHRRVIELTEEKSSSGRPARRDDVGSS